MEGFFKWYVLLWFDFLLVPVLLVAFTTAVFAHVKWRWLQISIPVLVSLLILALFGLALYWAFFLHLGKIQPSWFLAYVITLAAVYLAASITILLLGLKKHEKIPRAGSWLSGWIALAFFAAVIIGVSTVTHMILRIYDGMEKEFETAKNQAYSMLPPPPSENAAPIYRKALGILDKDMPDWFYKTHRPDFDPTDEKVEAFLKENREPLDLLHKAASTSEFHYPLISLESVIELGFFGTTRFLHVRGGSRLMALDARNKAKRGKINDALRCINDIQNMASHVYKYPGSLINCAIARGIEFDALWGLENLLYEAPIDSLSEITFQFKKNDITSHDFLRAICIEKAFILNSAIKDDTTFMESFYLPCFSDRDNLNLLEKLLDHIITPLNTVFMTPSDIASRMARISELMNLLEKPCHERQRGLRGILENPERGMTAVLLSYANISDFYNWTYGLQARRHLADLALAVCAYHTREGKYPFRVEDLAPRYIEEIPTDPFDCRSLKMKAKETGAVLYSVGRNRVDDGGVKPKKPSGFDDISIKIGSMLQREQPAAERLEQNR